VTDGFAERIKESNGRNEKPTLQMVGADELTEATQKQSGLVPVSMFEVFPRGEAPTISDEGIFVLSWGGCDRPVGTADTLTPSGNSLRPIAIGTYPGTNVGSIQASAKPITSVNSDAS